MICSDPLLTHYIRAIRGDTKSLHAHLNPWVIWKTQETMTLRVQSPERVRNFLFLFKIQNVICASPEQNVKFCHFLPTQLESRTIKSTSRFLKSNVLPTHILSSSFFHGHCCVICSEKQKHHSSLFQALSRCS